MSHLYFIERGRPKMDYGQCLEYVFYDHGCASFLVDSRDEKYRTSVVFIFMSTILRYVLCCITIVYSCIYLPIELHSQVNNI